MKTVSNWADVEATPLLSGELLERAGELLRALAAPVRIAIVMQLRESQRCVHELVDALDVPSRWSASTSGF